MKMDQVPQSPAKYSAHVSLKLCQSTLANPLCTEYVPLADSMVRFTMSSCSVDNERSRYHAAITEKFLPSVSQRHSILNLDSSRSRFGTIAWHNVPIHSVWDPRFPCWDSHSLLRVPGVRFISQSDLNQWGKFLCVPQKLYPVEPMNAGTINLKLNSPFTELNSLDLSYNLAGNALLFANVEASDLSRKCRVAI